MTASDNLPHVQRWIMLMAFITLLVIAVNKVRSS
jgi:hypothetical protein